MQECHYFHTGVCRRGDTCNFQHTEPKLGKCPNARCKLCENYKDGSKRFRGSDVVKPTPLIS